MKNINIPGVFPLFIAAVLAYGALRSHAHVKKYNTPKSKSSRLLFCIAAVLFCLIALFQILESFGISFR